MKYLILLLLLVSCNPDISEVKYNPIVIEYQGEIQTILNSKRIDNNVLELQPEQKLTSIANTLANSMHDGDMLPYLHKGFETRAKLSKAYIYGECFGYYYITPQSSISAWISSPLHRNTILNGNYKYFGYAKRGKYECLLLANYK